MKISTKFIAYNGLILMAVAGLFSLAPSQANALTCTSHATRQCISNVSYWYNSCGVLEDVAQNCNTANQTCQSGQCVAKTPTPTPTPSPTPSTNHYTKSCYNGSLYWYTSTGALSDLYQNCTDSNQCTLDNCAIGACVNELKCDGSTCAVSSADYIKYCPQNNPGTQSPTPTTTQNQGLAISLFTSKDATKAQLQKSLTVANGDKINFVVIVKNTSGAPIDNVAVTTDISTNISYTGNLAIDNLASAGSPALGITLGTIPAKTSKTISFAASVTPQPNQTIAQVTTTINSAGTISDSDYVIMNIAAAGASGTVATNDNSLFNNIKKNWIIWLVIVIVLMVVFIIIFRRLSTNV